MAFSHYSIECLPAHIREGTLDKRVQIMFTQELNFEGGKTHKSRVASRSRENAFDINVMASFAVFSVNSSAPAIIVVSS